MGALLRRFDSRAPQRYFLQCSPLCPQMNAIKVSARTATIMDFDPRDDHDKPLLAQGTVAPSVHTLFRMEPSLASEGE